MCPFCGFQPSFTTRGLTLLRINFCKGKNASYINASPSCLEFYPLSVVAVVFDRAFLLDDEYHARFDWRKGETI